MAFRDFFRGDRDRDEDERGRERWRPMSRDWRDEERGRDQDWERGYRGQGYGSERGWSPGSEYYGDRPQSYRADYDDEREGRSYGARRWGQGSGRWEHGGEREDYGGRYGHTSGMSRWGEDERNYGAGSYGRGGGSDVYGRDYGAGIGGFSGGGWGRNYSRGAGGSMGEGGYGRDMEQGRRGASGYGGYGGMGGAETGRWSGQGAQQEWGQDFRGKGPRGYRRSDQRIHEEVCDALTDDPHIDASNMEVTVKDGEVTLSGAVSSREEKRMAEDLVERISGVKDVTNNLRVQQPQQQQQAQGQMEKMTSPPARH